MTRYVFDKLIKAPGSLVFYSQKLSSTFRILVVVDRDFVYSHLKRTFQVVASFWWELFVEFYNLHLSLRLDLNEVILVSYVFENQEKFYIKVSGNLMKSILSILQYSVSQMDEVYSKVLCNYRYGSLLYKKFFQQIADVENVYLMLS